MFFAGIIPIPDAGLEEFKVVGPIDPSSVWAVVDTLVRDRGQAVPAVLLLQTGGRCLAPDVEFFAPGHANGNFTAVPGYRGDAGGGGDVGWEFALIVAESLTHHVEDVMRTDACAVG